MVTSYGLEEHVLIPGSGTDFSLTSRLYRLCCPGMMEEVKWLESETKYCPIFSMKVKNVWSSTYTAPCVSVEWFLIKHKARVRFPAEERIFRLLPGLYLLCYPAVILVVPGA